MHHSRSEGHTQIVELPRETEGLPEPRRTELVELADGDEFALEIMPVKKRIGDATVRMLTYNGSVPGPTSSSTKSRMLLSSARRWASAPRRCCTSPAW